MTYRAPVEDMDFALRELASLERVLGEGFPAFDMDLVQPILEEAGKFAADVLAPLNQPGAVQSALSAMIATIGA